MSLFRQLVDPIEVMLIASFPLIQIVAQYASMGFTMTTWTQRMVAGLKRHKGPTQLSSALHQDSLQVRFQCTPSTKVQNIGSLVHCPIKSKLNRLCN